MGTGVPIKGTPGVLNLKKGACILNKGSTFGGQQTECLGQKNGGDQLPPQRSLKKTQSAKLGKKIFFGFRYAGHPNLCDNRLPYLWTPEGRHNPVGCGGPGGSINGGH